MKRYHKYGPVWVALLCLFFYNGEIAVAQSLDAPKSAEVDAEADTLQQSLLPVEIHATACLEAVNFAGKAIVPLGQLGHSSLSETLNQNSQLQINQYGPSGLATVSFMGGGASQTRVFWNGFELNSPALGLFDLSLFPLNDSQISLYTGASSLALGNGGLSGAVNLTNKLASPEGFQFSSEIGSFGVLRLTSSAQKQLGRLQVGLGGNYGRAENDFKIFHSAIQAQDPDRRLQEAGQRYAGVHADAIFTLNSNSELSFRGEYQEVDRALPPALFASSQGESQEDENLRAYLGYKRSGKRSRLEVKSGLFVEHLNYSNEQLSLDNRYSLFRSDNQLRYSLAVKETVQVYFHTGLKYESYRSPGFDISKLRRFSSSSMISSDWQFSKAFKLKALLRSSVEDDFFAPALAPLLELRYQHEALELAINAGSNLRRPTLNDLHWNPGGNPDLQPERSRQLLAEVKYAKVAPTGNFNWSAQLIGWWTAFSNQIVWLPGSTGIWTPENLRESLHRGSSFDLSCGAKDLLEWQFNAGYSYTSATHQGEQMRFVPRHKGYANFSGKLDRVQGTFGLVASGKRESDGGTLAAWTTLNFGLSYQLFKYPVLIVEGRLNNLTNTYFEMVQNRPLPGRNYTIGLKFNLQKQNS